MENCGASPIIESILVGCFVRRKDIRDKLYVPITHPKNHTEPYEIGLRTERQASPEVIKKLIAFSVRQVDCNTTAKKVAYLPVDILLIVF